MYQDMPFELLILSEFNEATFALPWAGYLFIVNSVLLLLATYHTVGPGKVRTLLEHSRDEVIHTMLTSNNVSHW